MKDLKKYMGKATLAVVLAIAFYKIIDASFEGGIYKYTVVGAVFEMTWLPLLLCLAALPILWLVYMLRKEVAFKKGITYIGVCVLSIVGVLCL